MLKSITRSFVKILFVVIFPISFIYLCFHVVNTYGGSTELIVSLLLLGVCVLFNSIMYLVFMSRVRMLPKITVELVPIFGFAFGIDPNNTANKISWLLLIPFVSFEFTSNTSKDEQ